MVVSFVVLFSVYDSLAGAEYPDQGIDKYVYRKYLAVVCCALLGKNEQMLRIYSHSFELLLRIAGIHVGSFGCMRASEKDNAE